LQPGQHPAGISRVGGLSEDQVVDDDHGVRAEHGRLEVTRGGDARLLARQTADVSGRRFADQNGLVDRGGIDVETEAGGAEQISASW